MCIKWERNQNLDWESEAPKGNNKEDEAEL